MSTRSGAKSGSKPDRIGHHMRTRLVWRQIWRQVPIFYRIGVHHVNRGIKQLITSLAE